MHACVPALSIKIREHRKVAVGWLFGGTNNRRRRGAGTWNPFGLVLSFRTAGPAAMPVRLRRRTRLDEQLQRAL